MYSRIPPSEHVASVNLFPPSSINDSTITAIFVFCQMKSEMAALKVVCLVHLILHNLPVSSNPNSSVNTPLPNFLNRISNYLLQYVPVTPKTVKDGNRVNGE